MPNRMADGAGMLRHAGFFLMRWGGALALGWLIIDTGLAAFGWSIGVDGITTTAGEVQALRRSVSTTGIRVDTLSTRVETLARRTIAERESLRVEVNELRAQVIPLLEAQSRFLCFDNRPVADVAGVPCTDLRRRQGARGP